MLANVVVVVIVVVVVVKQVPVGTKMRPSDFFRRWGR